MGAFDCVTGEKIKNTQSTEVFTVNMAASNPCLDNTRRDVEGGYDNSGTRHSLWWNLCIDIPLFFLVLVIFLLVELNSIPHHQGGYFCNDPALSYKYTGDSVSSTAVILVALLLPLALIFATEFIFILPSYFEYERLYNAMRNTIWLYRSYMYGLLFNIVIVQAMKATAGYPRPTFFDICGPVKADTSKACTGSEFVQSFECTSTRFSAWFMRDSYNSFPSGHTSLSVYGAFFLAWYLHRRAFNWRSRTTFLVPILQMALVTYAAVCSLTRITDHRHHWMDVAVGALIGVLSMLYAVLVLCYNFNYCQIRDCDGQQQSSTILSDSTTRRTVAQ